MRIYSALPVLLDSPLSLSLFLPVLANTFAFVSPESVSMFYFFFAVCLSTIVCCCLIAVFYFNACFLQFKHSVNTYAYVSVCVCAQQQQQQCSAFRNAIKMRFAAAVPHFE